MTETITGTNRSAGIGYTELLARDTRPVPEHLLAESPMPPGTTRVPTSVYTSRAFHDLEVERLWKRVWQLACHEDEIAHVGDYVVYDIAHLSFLIIRTGDGPDDIAALRNACLHRGRKLRERDGTCAKVVRCAFHGWSWTLDGAHNEIPCQWDFPSVDPETNRLPAARVARHGGFVFINPDPEAEPFDDFLGSFPETMATLPMERRFKAVHVAKLMRVNWKACQEAFMEAYHVVATHPTLLATMGDANSRYDVFENYSRAISPNSTRSPHLPDGDTHADPPDALQYARVRHPFSGFLYERADEGRVRVIDHDGTVSLFDEGGRWLDGPLREADPHLCRWVGGPLLPGSEASPVPPTEGSDTDGWRAATADARRMALRRTVGDRLDVDAICDAELVDAIYYTVFPNWHPWGCFNALNYRFRPYGDDPEACIFEVMLLVPSPGERRPAPAPIQWLGFDDDWTLAPALGPLVKIFQQDSLNLPWVQRGLHNLQSGSVVLGQYGESKVRHFHALLQRWLDVDYDAMLDGVPVEVRSVHP
jgi:phenylpropionate dioxygenase-like ring-hydroxylating dioxygenase large terminal subunit